MKEVIAIAQYVYIAEFDSFTSVVVKIGKPYQVDTGDAACSVSVEGLQNKLPDVHGVDTFQALSLAIDLAKKVLHHFVEHGGKLYYATDITTTGDVTEAVPISLEMLL